MDTVKVSKVVIEIGGKETELTLEQAKALHEALGELFKAPIVFDTHKSYPIYVPYVIPERPYRPWEPWITWCVSDDSTAKFQVI